MFCNRPKIRIQILLQVGSSCHTGILSLCCHMFGRMMKSMQLIHRCTMHIVHTFTLYSVHFTMYMYLVFYTLYLPIIWRHVLVTRLTILSLFWGFSDLGVHRSRLNNPGRWICSGSAPSEHNFSLFRNTDYWSRWKLLHRYWIDPKSKCE